MLFINLSDWPIQTVIVQERVKEGKMAVNRFTFLSMHVYMKEDLTEIATDP